MAFQTSMALTQSPGVAGDFCSVNPRNSALSVEGGYTAAPAGLTIGLFAWADTATGKILGNAGAGAPTCFVHRNLQAMITAYPSEFGMTIPSGFGVGEMFSAGDFWVKNAGTGAVAIGQKAFANNANGTVTFAAAGATVSGSTETKWFAQSPGASGELIKMTSTPLG